MVSMVKQDAKDLLRDLLNQLPDNCSLEDIQYHLYVMEKVQFGLKASEVQVISQDQAEDHLSQWLIK